MAKKKHRRKKTAKRKKVVHRRRKRIGSAQMTIHFPKRKIRSRLKKRLAKAGLRLKHGYETVRRKRKIHGILGIM